MTREMTRQDWEFLYSCKKDKMITPALMRFFRERINANPYTAPVSLSDKPRTYYIEDGESFREYGIFDRAGMSDSEVEEILHDEYESCQIHSYYDCTGKIFMSWYSWKPLAGNRISVVKSFGRDV